MYIHIIYSGGFEEYHNLPCIGDEKVQVHTDIPTEIQPECVYACGRLDPSTGYWIGWCGCNVREELQVRIIGLVKDYEQGMIYLSNYNYEKHNRMEVVWLAKGEDIISQREL